MESEKVKELKDYIQKSADLGQYYMLAGGKITMMEVVDYINELESENEKLKWEKQTLEDKDTLLSKVGELSKENQQLKDRIVELEKERVFYKDGICYPMNCQGALKQFAERLNEKVYQVHDGYFEVLTGQPAIAVDIVVLENLLDETLKEFTT